MNLLEEYRNIIASEAKELELKIEYEYPKGYKILIDYFTPDITMKNALDGYNSKEKHKTISELYKESVAIRNHPCYNKYSEGYLSSLSGEEKEKLLEEDEEYKNFGLKYGKSN